MLYLSPAILSTTVRYTDMERMSQKNDAWVETDVAEIMALIGLFYHLGAKKLYLVSVDKIWSGIACDPVAKATMSKKRFVALCNALRFDDKGTRSARRAKDIFCPIREIFDQVNSKLSKYFTLGMNMTVDEQLIPRRGRVKFLQYLPSKPDKYGIKMFWICD